MKINFKLNSFPYKSIYILLLCFALMFGLFWFSLTSYANPGIGIYVDNHPLRMDVPPIIIQGRTLIPISALGNALNCKVSWNEKNQSVIIRNNKSIVRLSINSKLAYIDDNPMKLDYPPIIVNSRTMVPLSFVTKALNHSIKWDPVLMNVHVTTDTRNMSIAEATQSYNDVIVIDAITLKMNIRGQIKTVKLDGVAYISDKNSSLTGGSDFKSQDSTKVQLEKIQNLISSGDISAKIINTIDNDTVIAQVYVDGTSLSQLLIELGYVVEID